MKIIHEPAGVYPSRPSTDLRLRFIGEDDPRLSPHSGYRPGYDLWNGDLQAIASGYLHCTDITQHLGHTWPGENGREWICDGHYLGEPVPVNPHYDNPSDIRWFTIPEGLQLSGKIGPGIEVIIYDLDDDWVEPEASSAPRRGWLRRLFGR